MNGKISLQCTFLFILGFLVTTPMFFSTAHAASCEEAKSYFSKALAVPDEAGNVNYLMEKERLYKKALELCPGYAEAYNNLGDVYERLGSFSDAIANYSKAAELRKDMAEPHFGLGDIYFKSGNYSEAIRWYERGLKIKPKDQLSIEMKGQAEDLLRKKVITEDRIVSILGRSPIENPMLTRGLGDVVKMSFGSDEKMGLIPFDIGKYEIREDAKPQLNELGKALSSKELSAYLFEIGGHTDIRGSEAYNLELSLNRAMAVKKYLTESFRIPGDRLTVNGYGKYNPIALGTDEASHAMNRRVEIKRLDKGGSKNSSAVPEPSDKEKIALDLGFLYRDGKVDRRVIIRSDGSTVLRTGKDPYQIFFRPHQDCYVYLLQKDSDGKWHLLFPGKKPDSKKNPVAGKKDYWVPGFDEGFLLAGNKGEETIYLLASNWKIAGLESSGPLQPEIVVPITRSFQVRGVSHIGTPRVAQVGSRVSNYDEIISQVEGQGGLIRAISFKHQ